MSANRFGFPIVGVAGTSTDAPPTLSFQGGDAAAGTNDNGANIDLKPGLGDGTGLKGEVTIDGSTGGFVAINVPYYPGLPAGIPIFVASRAYRVKSVICRPLLLEVLAQTLTIKKAASGTPITAGTALTTAGFSLSAASVPAAVADTNQTGTLAAAAALEIPAGTAIGVDMSIASPLAAVGVVTVTLVPV